MFNRQPFNRGRFNRKNTGKVYFEGSANTSLFLNGQLSVVQEISGEIVIELILKGYKGIPHFFQGNTAIALTAKNEKLDRIRTFSGNVNTTLGLKMDDKFRLIAALEGNADIELAATSRLTVVNVLHGSAETSLVSVGELNRRKILLGNSDIILDIDVPLNINIPYEGNIAKGLTIAVDFLGIRQSLRGTAHIVLATLNEGFNIWRYEHIHLPNLVIGVGGELIIDTDNMTITMNGQNVMRFLSRDSEFFLLNPATNELTFTSGNANNRADIRVLWRDAWL